MRLHATGRDLIITEKERLISGSINMYTCEFTFDSSWDGYMVTAVFSTANKVVNRAIVDGKCDIPPEVLRPNVRLRIGVFGNDGVRTRPTTYSEWLPVEQGADTNGRSGRPPEPSVYEQWMNGISEQVDDWAEADAMRVIEKTTVSGEHKPAGEAVPAVQKQLNEDGSMNLHFLLSSGVYVGSGVMPEGCNVQIDPMGDVLTPEDFVIDSIDPEEVAKIVEEYLEENPPAQGEKGEPGEDGEDGYTPVRGTDYWTEDDIASIKGYVDEAILGGAW